MPVYNDGQTNGQISPRIQNISWERGTAYPALNDIFVQSNNAQIVSVYFQFVGTSINWINSPGNGSTDFIINDFTGSSIISLVLQNLEQLPNNSYKCIIQFEFSKPTGSNVLVNEEINLSLSGVSGIQTDKSIYNLIFNRANNTLSGDTTVNILNNVDNKILSLLQVDNIFKPKSGFTNSFLIENDSSNPLINNANLPATGLVNFASKLLGEISQVVASFDISLLILDQNGLAVFPSDFHFDVIKNSVEKSATLKITNPLNIDFTIQSPSWLSSSINAGNSSTDVVFTTLSDNLPSGETVGLIFLIFNGRTFEIPVSITLKEFVTIELQEHNFCLDLQTIYFSKINENARWVLVSIYARFEVMGCFKTFSQSFSIPYVDGKCMFELGKKLHSYFPRYRKHLFDIAPSVEFMKPIKCSIKIEELDIDYNNILTENLNDIKFFPGHKPVMYPIFSNFAHRKKNNKSVFFNSFFDGINVITEKINDTIIIEDLIKEDKKIKYHQFPEHFHSIEMQWENGNFVPEWFTFAADYTISADFTHIISKNVLNSLQEKFETSKIKKLQIGTGFILAQEIEMILELTENRLAFIKIKNKVYQCFNITSKLILDNSSESIVERDLEFIIVED